MNSKYNQHSFSDDYSEINFAFNRAKTDIEQLKHELKILAAKDILWTDILYAAAQRGYSFYNSLVTMRDNGVI